MNSTNEIVSVDGEKNFIIEKLSTEKSITEV